MMQKKFEAVQEALWKMGDPNPPLAITAVGGGSISEAYKVRTSEGTYFFKYKAEAPSNFFASRMDSLERSLALKPELTLSQEDILGFPVCWHSTSTGF